MLEALVPLAFGPIGGIDPGEAVKWVIIWTVIMGVMLYGSVIFFPSWVDLPHEGDHHHHHH